ncbi:TetR/AcrR family transcriptional regulator [Mycobacteriaceae bacterium NPDC060252]
MSDLADNGSSSRYHHGDLRHALLSRAVASIEEVGTDGLSLRQLARDIGVSHGAPNRHFADKRALLNALAIQGFALLGEAFASAASATGFTERMTALARIYLQFALQRPALLGVMFTQKHSPSSDAVADAAEKAFALPISFIVEAQARGEVVHGDPKQIGLSCVATLQGLSTLLISGFVSSFTADELLSDTIKRLMIGIQPRT